MDHLRSSVTELRGLFERAVSARYIAESLLSFDEERKAVDVRNVLEDREFDVVGVRSHGQMHAYARRENLNTGRLGDHAEPFEELATVGEDESILQVFRVLAHGHSPVWVRRLRCVDALVARGDLEKTPARLWLFGLLSLLEMQAERVVRDQYGDTGWRDLITRSRRGDAEKLFAKRRERNEQLDLTACLQLGDKLRIVAKSPEIREQVDMSGNQLKKHNEYLKRLRDALAHGRSILEVDVPDLFDLVEGTETLLAKLEALSSPRGSRE